MITFKKRFIVSGALCILLLVGSLSVYAAETVVGWEDFSLSFSAQNNTPDYSDQYSMMREGGTVAWIKGLSLGGESSAIRLRVVALLSPSGYEQNVTDIFYAQLGTYTVTTYPAFNNASNVYELKGWANYNEAYFSGKWHP